MTAAKKLPYKVSCLEEDVATAAAAAAAAMIMIVTTTGHQGRTVWKRANCCCCRSDHGAIVGATPFQYKENARSKSRSKSEWRRFSPPNAAAVPSSPSEPSSVR